jgi:hypothetical protein
MGRPLCLGGYFLYDGSNNIAGWCKICQRRLVVDAYADGVLRIWNLLAPTHFVGSSLFFFFFIFFGGGSCPLLCFLEVSIIDIA